MPVIDSQPSPFGHLTRERHIESVSRPPKKKQNFSEAEETPQGTGGFDSTGVARSPPARAVQSRFANPYSCHVDAWMCPKAVPLQSECPEPPASPLVQPGSKDRLRPPLQQEVKGVKDNSHPGLQILAGVSQLCITSKTELRGVSGNLARRGYIISTAANERGLLVVTEGYSQCCFHLCGPARSCHLYLQDREGRVVLWFCRPFRMSLGCLCSFCPMEMRAFTSDNQLVGIVRQRCSIFSHLLEVCDARGLAIMEIRGFGTLCRCLTQQEFQVLSSAGHTVATIWKKWPGFREEHNKDHEFFGVDMAAADLSNEERACLLAATFLLNFMFFEVS